MRQGTIVATSPAFAHRLSDVFSEPLAYQPDRYLPPRSEDKAAPFSYIGFGGGRHACLGQNFAYLQIKVGLCPMSTAHVPLVVKAVEAFNNDVVIKVVRWLRRQRPLYWVASATSAPCMSLGRMLTCT